MATLTIPGIQLDAPELAPKYNFDLKKDGQAKMDGSDESDKLDAVIDLACQYIADKGTGAEVYIPPGTLSVSRPFWQGMPKLRIRGGGKYITQINYLGSAIGPNVIGAPKRTSGSGAPQYVQAMCGTALKCLFTNSDADYLFDLTAYKPLRLAPGPFTIEYAITDIPRLPTEGEFFLGLPGTCTGQLYAGQPWYVTVTNVMVAYNGQLKFQFRYGGTVLDFNVETASKTRVAPGDTLHIEIDWDPSAKIMRFYLNGDLWTMGHYTPPVGDGSGFTHNEWERMTIGSGYMGDFPNEGASGATLPCSLRYFRVSDVVRHTGSSFTAHYCGDDPVDGNTILHLDFSRVSKLGCLIGRSGLGAGQDVHLYPACHGTLECPQLELLDLGFWGGQGVRYEFASGARFENIFHLYPNDGWQIMRNGYKTALTNVTIAAGLGRFGLMLGGGDADCLLNNVDAAGPMCFVTESANAVFNNCEAPVHANYRIGYLIKGAGGTNAFVGGGVDAEEVTPNFIAAALVADPQACTFMATKLYAPPGSTKSPVLYPIPLAPRPGNRLNLIGCLLNADPTVPLIKTGGVHASKIDVFGCSNQSGSDVCDFPENVNLI